MRKTYMHTVIFDHDDEEKEKDMMMMKISNNKRNHTCSLKP
jgi:hypothetical protein